jgi:hypothetical protein
MGFPRIPNYVIISGEKNSGEIVAIASAILGYPNHISVSTDNNIRKEFFQAFKTFNWQEVVFEFYKRVVTDRFPYIPTISTYNSSYNVAAQIIPTLTQELTFEALRWTGKGFPDYYNINYENMKQVAKEIIVSNDAEFIKFKKFTFWIALDKQGYSLAQDIYHKFSGKEDPDEVSTDYKICGFHKLNLIEQEIFPPTQTHPSAREYYAWFESIYKSLEPWRNSIMEAMSYFS